MRRLVASVLAGLALAATLGSSTANAGGPSRTEYMPCGSEDSVNCVWDARHMGNGQGRSFFVGRDGHVTYLPHHIAHFLISGGAR